MVSGDTRISGWSGNAAGTVRLICSGLHRMSSKRCTCAHTDVFPARLRGLGSAAADGGAPLSAVRLVVPVSGSLLRQNLLTDSGRVPPALRRDRPHAVACDQTVRDGDALVVAEEPIGDQGASGHADGGVDQRLPDPVQHHPLVPSGD